MMLAGIAAGLGLILLVVGLWPRRTGAGPVCRSCDFSLAGLADAARCPECGADLAVKRAIRQGHRRRRPLLAAFGLLVLLAGAGWAGIDLYRSVTGPGWEHRAPGWWLAEVEMRYASGSRLDEAYLGLRTRRPRVSDSTIDRARIVLFGRILRESETPGAARPNRMLLGFLQDGVPKGSFDDRHVATLIRNLTIVHPQGGGSTGQDLLPRCDAAFLPSGWFVTYEWVAVDANGGKPGFEGAGFRGHGDNRSEVRGTSSMAPPGQLVCHWDLAIRSPDVNTDPILVWQFEHAVVKSSTGASSDVPKQELGPAFDRNP